MAFRKKTHDPFRWFGSSPEVIRLVVIMYVRYPLSLRNVEDLLFERGIDICHETVRLWWTYLRRQKNDAADAEAICEAITRPTMRLVPIKSGERQGVLVLHRTRELLVRQRTMLINAIRGTCAEFGIMAP